MAQAVPVIAVDGPSGTGKGTLCELLASRLGWHCLDSGAIYRVVAFAALRGGLDFNDTRALQQAAAGLDLRFAPSSEGIRVHLDGEDVTQAIRSEDCGNAASRVAAIPEVRAALLARQRAFRQSPGLVADGRDMGTVVFPDAPLKVFLTATPAERARRRYKQLKDKGVDVSLPALLAEIAARDDRDRLRSVSPLVPAADARLIDTTYLGIAAVLEQVFELAREKELA